MALQLPDPAALDTPKAKRTPTKRRSTTKTPSKRAAKGGVLNNRSVEVTTTSVKAPRTARSPKVAKPAQTGSRSTRISEVVYPDPIKPPKATRSSRVAKPDQPITRSTRTSRPSRMATSRSPSVAKVVRSRGGRKAVTPSTALVQTGGALVIDPGEIANQQTPNKQPGEYRVEPGDTEIVVRIKYPQQPEGSKASPAAVRELFEWWIKAAVAESTGVVTKALEYGARDIMVLGRTMAETMKLDVASMSRSELEGLGIYFFCASKMGRWESAIQEGRQVSDDSLIDIGVYVKMYQRARDIGGWPGVDLNQ